MSGKTYNFSVIKGPKPGLIFPLLASTITIGRDPMSDITLNDPEISRYHAQLLKTNDDYQIQDMGSTNGTYVSGHRIVGDPVTLSSGDEIAFGNGIVVLYEIMGVESPDAPDSELEMTDHDFEMTDSDFEMSDSDFEIPDNDDFGMSDSDDIEVPDSLDFEVSDGLDFEVSDGLDFEVPESVDFKVPESVDFKVSDSDDFEMSDGLDFEVPDSMDFEAPDIDDFELTGSDSDEDIAVPTMVEVDRDFEDMFDEDMSEKFETAVPEMSSPPPISSPLPNYQPEIPQQSIPGDDEEARKKKRNITMIVAAVVLICCCCAFSIYAMYEWGGDILLEELEKALLTPTITP